MCCFTSCAAAPHVLLYLSGVLLAQSTLAHMACATSSLTASLVQLVALLLSHVWLRRQWLRGLMVPGLRGRGRGEFGRWHA